MLLKAAISILCFATLADCQFEIDYDHDTFLMDGQPFRYVSGSVHYFRMPRQYWRDRLSKLKAAGLNAVSTYVEWSQHEKEIGRYDFTGDLNILEFIQTAKEEGLLVILRVGPYICGERTMGGFPYWLLRENPDIKLRVSDTTYQNYVEKWLNVLLPIVSPMLFGNGGPIISLQIENEYGFYVECDHNHTSWLAGIFRKHVQDKAILFTTDGSDYGALSCGKIPDVYATVDFGPGANVTEIYLKHKAVEPRGPFVNSEFYPGWMTHWGERWATGDTDNIIKTLKEILDVGGNVNFYMFYGGTNFGFTAGANGGPYFSDVTSYDYDAPISEAGDLTPKYLRIREFLLDYLSVNTTLPENSPKGDYGSVNLKKTALFPSFGWRDFFGREVSAEYPQSFEDISQDEGYVLYEVMALTTGNLTLQVDVRDNARVLVNYNFAGKLSREQQTTRLNLNVTIGDIISILIENGGRINNGGENNDRKGILSNVTLDGKVMTHWTMTAFNFDDVYEKLQGCTILDLCDVGVAGFPVYTGTFTANTLSNIEYDGEALLADSFLDVSELTKGLVLVNGHNLGRYWSTRGPQYSLYVPGAYLKKAPDVNTIVVIDEEINRDSITVPFSKNPIIGDPK